MSRAAVPEPRGVPTMKPSTPSPFTSPAADTELPKKSLSALLVTTKPSVPFRAPRLMLAGQGCAVRPKTTHATCLLLPAKRAPITTSSTPSPFTSIPGSGHGQARTETPRFSIQGNPVDAVQEGEQVVFLTAGEARSFTLGRGVGSRCLAGWSRDDSC